MMTPMEISKCDGFCGVSTFFSAVPRLEELGGHVSLTEAPSSWAKILALLDGKLPHTQARVRARRETGCADSLAIRQKSHDS